VGEAFFSPTTRKYTAEEIRRATDKYHGKIQEVEGKRSERAERGRDALGDVDGSMSLLAGKTSGTGIGVGDEVLVRYRDVGPRWEQVAFVNFQNGKVAIAMRRFSPSSDKTISLLAYMLGLRKTGVREYRYIHPDQISDVRSPEKPLPFALSGEMRERIEAFYGWRQFTAGVEFIERSYVVATTKDGAKHGANYDCASAIIYRDPVLNLYWRETGSFD
jgi:hypothetical protein